MCFSAPSLCLVLYSCRRRRCRANRMKESNEEEARDFVCTYGCMLMLFDCWNASRQHGWPRHACNKRVSNSLRTWNQFSKSFVHFSLFCLFYIFKHLFCFGLCFCLLFSRQIQWRFIKHTNTHPTIDPSKRLPKITAWKYWEQKASHTVLLK